jgi:hypothetical protein
VSAEELAVIIEQLVIEADERYVRSLGRIQTKLYNELVLILKDLELQDGYIKQNSANRRILTVAYNKIGESFSSPTYSLAVSNYVAIIPKIDAANIQYFSALDAAFEPNKIYLKNIQKELVQTVNQYVLQDGLQSQVIQPMNQILNQNVNAGGQFSGFINQTKEYIVGTPEVESRAMSYTRTFIKDTLYTYSRTYQQAVTADLGLQYYMYSGGVMDTTRDFCEERAGNIYSKKEVESWAELEWKGKKKGTTESSIFHFAGGWNCGHQIIPVSDFIVPQEVKDRNK